MRSSPRGPSGYTGDEFESKSKRTAGKYTNEARISRRAEESETFDQNRTE